MKSNDEPRVALVTGGAQGIGAAIARRLAADGYVVVVADLNQSGAEIVAAEFDGIGVGVDLSEPEQVIHLAQTVEEKFGRIDILVNNAAIQPYSAWQDLTYTDWRRVMAVNLDGMFILTHAISKQMMVRGYGRIINIASNTFQAGTPHFVHYVTSKGALIGFVRSLASELGPYGITVNAVAPGLTATEGVLKGGHGEDFDFVVPLQAFKRRGTPADIAPAVAFLASKEAGWITGQTLVVDGGHTRN